MAQEDKRLKRRVRNSYLISTVSIAMVLFLLGSTTYLILNALKATERLRESVVIHVMLVDGLSAEQTSSLRTQLEDQEIVRSVIYIPKSEAAAQFIAESGEDFTAFLGDDPEANPLPDSFEVGLAARGSERETIEAFVAATEAADGVDDVVYQRSVVEQIGTNLGKFAIVLLLFGGALMVVSLILLNNTIRMTIIAKRRIINTMKLVGANAGFIMRPFVASAALHGLVAGVIATGVFALLVVGLHEGAPGLDLLRGNMLLAAIAGGMIVLGVVMSLLFTVFAVRKATRQESVMALI
ncbi:MAG: permease-like cell division protein FtsX [Alistipes sp.]|jgi:cell division transport system permease protein|nr:permease-like cell division protein FtsX [Alistipes sp.]